MENSYTYMLLAVWDGDSHMLKTMQFLQTELCITAWRRVTPRICSPAPDCYVNKKYTSTVYIRGLFVILANILLCNLLLSLKNISQTFFHVSTYTVNFLEAVLYFPQSYFLKLRDSSYLRSTVPKKFPLNDQGILESREYHKSYFLGINKIIQIYCCC